MSRSEAQRFAQRRNTAGGCLKGVITNLKNTIKRSATSKEAEHIDKAIEELQSVHGNWSDNYESAKEELM